MHPLSHGVSSKLPASKGARTHPRGTQDNHWSVGRRYEDFNLHLLSIFVCFLIYILSILINKNVHN